ncbi:hypothetical protein SVAN01_11337 [Stagonosporopsis vannaccii]|nr:hypothetical protein SVAN01_11337 [Stagonosporopsis vannaccii]
MAEERAREHKRNCHYTEDIHPVFFVQPGTNPLPEENHRLAARVALLESRLSLLDANTTAPTAPYAFGSSPGQWSNATDRQQGGAHPGARVDSDYASLLDDYTLQSLIDVYFRRCHQHPYTYFHEATFRQNLDIRSLPSYLTFAIAAIAVSYSNEPCFVGCQNEAMNSYSRLAWSQIMEQSFSDEHGPSIHTVQAANMLGIVDYVAGRPQVAWVKIGLAVRLAQTLQLGNEPPPGLPQNAAEERRNTFWSIYILDKLVSCGRHRPPTLLDADCKVRLPVNPCSLPTSLQAEPPTLAAIQEIPDMPALEKSDHFALTIFMVSALGHIAKWAFRQGASETRLPWDSRSEFARISGMILSFESYSDACDGNFVDILDKHFVFQGLIDEGMSSHFTYSHLVYSLNQCLLHHPFLLRQHLQTFKAIVPVAFLRDAMLKSFEHASRLAAILRALQERGCETYPTFYAYAATIAGIILRLHCEEASFLEKDDVEASYKSCLRFLEQRSVRWLSYKRMRGLLKDFQPTPTLARKLLSFTLDRTPLEPDLEELLWHMCDYSWLVSSNRPTSDTVEESPVTSDSLEIAKTLNPRSGDTPDFDALLEGALSLDYSRLSNMA